LLSALRSIEQPQWVERVGWYFDIDSTGDRCVRLEVVIRDVALEWVDRRQTLARAFCDAIQEHVDDCLCYVRFTTVSESGG
jgi:hypothetical protein